MESFFSRYKHALVLMTVLVLQVIGLAVQVRRPSPDGTDGSGVRLVRLWMIDLVTPPERAAHALGLGVRHLWTSYIDLRHVRQQNRDLQAELDRLRLEQGGMAEDARQGLRLQKLLDFKEHYIYQTVAAQVIATSGADNSHVIYIDKGSADGVKPQMPVITPDGIVGKTRDVFEHTSQVLEVNDMSSGAGVMLETTRIRGVLRGNAYGQPEIVNISPDDRIKPGERVLTSGGDRIFPHGLAVGVVDRIVPDPETAFVRVRVKPAANLAQLEEVLVITGMGDKIPPSELADLEQNEAAARAAQQKAADILSEKLPSLKDPNTPDTAAAGPNAPASPSGDAIKVLPPGKALHPDRFTTGTVPPAAEQTPGQAAPVPPHAAQPQPSAPVQSRQQTPRPDGQQSPETGAAGNPGSGSNAASTGAGSPTPGTKPQTPHRPPAAAPANGADSPPGSAPAHVIVYDGPEPARSKPAPKSAQPRPAQPKPEPPAQPESKPADPSAPPQGGR